MGRDVVDPSGSGGESIAQRLATRRAELEARLRPSPQEAGGWPTQLREAAEQSLRSLGVAEQMLALGLYGVCLDCAEPIDPDRLRLDPELLFCHRPHGSRRPLLDISEAERA